MLHNNDFCFFACFKDTLFIQTNFTNSRSMRMDITIAFEDMIFCPNGLNLMPFLRTGVDTSWRLATVIDMFKSLFPKPPAELFHEDPEGLINASSTMYKVFLDVLIETAKKKGIALNISLKGKRALYANSLEWFRLNLEKSVDDIKNSPYSDNAVPYLTFKDNDIWFSVKKVVKFSEKATDIYNDNTATASISSAYTQLVGKMVFPLSDYGYEALSSTRSTGAFDIVNAAMHLSKTPEEFHERLKKVGLGRSMLVMNKAALIPKMFGEQALDLKTYLQGNELLALYTKTLWRNDHMLIKALNEGVS